MICLLQVISGAIPLGALAPLEAIDSTLCMGASIGYAMGIDKLLGDDAKGKAVAVYRGCHLSAFGNHQCPEYDL